MVKYIKRTTDNKFLQSIDTDVWVDDMKDSFEMTYLECENIKTILLNTYSEDQLKEIVNPIKIKPISDEEKKILRDLIKK